ncbi:MAG: hypothetical protein NZ742_03395 [Acidobacteria bacterium]|nr:hypothetical protein [Acidobacteriota bacterium]MDW7983467.1 hypothetical protein [Acidobacteriota bacterium]
MRWLRWLLAMGAISVLGVLLAAYWWHQRRMEESQFSSPSLEMDVFENFQDVRLRDGRPVFRFQARWYRLHAESVVEGQDVRIELPSDDAVTQITARAGWWYPMENWVVLNGQVRIHWRDLRVETERLTYRVEEGVAATETPVRWVWPTRHWAGDAQRGQYELSSAIVTMEGQVRMTTADPTGRYRLETEAIRWDLAQEVMEFVQPVRIVSLDGPTLDLGCGRFRCAVEADGTQVWSGQETCDGTFRRGDHTVKWTADALTGRLREAERRWHLTNGQFNLDDRWWVFGQRLWLSETPGQGLAMEADGGRLRVEPLQASPFYGRFQSMEADRLIWPSSKALDRLQVPGSLTIHMRDGHLQARDGFYDGQRWQARAPVLERTDGWRVTALSMVHDGMVLVLEGTETEPVRGSGVWQDKDWYIQAQRAELLSDQTIRWLGNVEIRSPDLLLTSDRWERRADTWQAEPVRRGRMWSQTGDRSYDVIFRSRRAEQGERACTRLEGDVYLEFHVPDRPGVLAVEAQQGDFCKGIWRLEGNLRFRYRDASGTAPRARMDWGEERLYVDGPVDLQDAQGRRARAQALRVDMKTERIELANPSPRRGDLTWTETARP